MKGGDRRNIQKKIKPTINSAFTWVSQKNVLQKSKRRVRDLGGGGENKNWPNKRKKDEETIEGEGLNWGYKKYFWLIY